LPIPLLETADIEVMRTQFSAWMDGVNARFYGLGVPDCPYAPRTAAGDAWENGWGVVNRHIEDAETMRLPVKQKPGVKECT
jgi:hypothetical protein